MPEEGYTALVGADVGETAAGGGYILGNGAGEPARPLEFQGAKKFPPRVPVLATAHEVNGVPQ